MRRRTRALVALGLGLAYAASLLLPALSLEAALLAALVTLGAEVLLRSSSRGWLPWIVQRTFGMTLRLTALELLVAVGVAVRFPRSAAIAVLTLMLASIVLRGLARRGAQAARARFEPRIAWRNLDVRHDPRPLAGNVFTEKHGWVLAAEVAVVVLAAFQSAFAGSVLVLELALAAIVLVRLVVAAAVGLVLLRERRVDHQERIDRNIREALERYDPQIVLLLGGHPETVNMANVWMPTLDAIRLRSVVVVRDRWHLPKIQTGRLPVVYLPSQQEVSEFLPASVGAAVYPINSDRNSDIINQPGIVDIFVGHGDSDKAGSANPVSRVYDEVWVAGPAAVDRYVKAGSGVDVRKIRQVGRPQWAEMERASHGSEADRRWFTVVYAPTWEGPIPEWSYSSIPVAGEMVKRLVRIPGVRVVYKRHHSTGTRDAQFQQHERRILETLARAGGPHRAVMTLDGLYQCFNEADLLITDISSVITDFLYFRKPYLVSNPHDTDPDAFRAEFPSTAGARLLPSDLAGLEEMVEDARGADSMRAERLAVADYLLGASTEPPLARFEDALWDVLGKQLASRP